MTVSNDNRTGLANARRTRLDADWAPTYCAAREYPVTDGPVANARRTRPEEIEADR